MKKLSACMMIGILFMAGCSNKEKVDQYTMKESAENGDTLVNEEGKVENLDKLLRFINQVEEKEKSDLVVSNFSNDQVSINELTYDGQSIFYVLKSGSGEEKSKSTCGTIEEKSGFISLQACEGEETAIGLVQVSEYEINKVKASMKN